MNRNIAAMMAAGVLAGRYPVGTTGQIEVEVVGTAGQVVPTGAAGLAALGPPVKTLTQARLGAQWDMLRAKAMQGPPRRLPEVQGG